jgi:hypothetical protein
MTCESVPQRAEGAEVVRLRVLWYALRSPGFDAPGAPGIAYDRDRVQTSPSVPTVPHGYGTGHAVDRVGLRIARTPPAAAAVLRWYRGVDAAADLAAGRVRPILDRLALALAPVGARVRWASSAPAGAAPAAVEAHAARAGRAWARARMAEAWDAWEAAR